MVRVFVLVAGIDQKSSYFFQQMQFLGKHILQKDV